MNDILPTVIAVCIIALTVALLVMTIKLIAILSQVKQSLSKANAVIDKADGIVDLTQEKLNKILNPFASLGVFISNFTAGLKVTEGFMDWLQRNKEERQSAKDGDADQPDQVEA